MAGRPSGRRHDVPNDLAPPPDQLHRGGGPFHSAPQRVERGTVIGVDAANHTYRVALNGGGTLNGIARMRSSPGDLTVLPLQQPVVVMLGLGEPYILGVLPHQAQNVANEDPDNVTGTGGHGGEDPTLARSLGAVGRTAGEPRDLLPGDQVLRSPDGAAVGALHGKTALVRGGPLAQIRAYGNEDLVEVVAGLYRLVTWMGEARYVNDDGKTSFIWRGGADQLTETGADEAAYTVRLDVGYTGDLFNFEVTTPQGQSLFRFHVDPNGRLSVTSRGGFEWTGGADRATLHPTRVHGAQSLEVEGAQDERVAGNVTQALQANRAATVSTNDNLTIGQDYVVRINRDHDVNVGGVMNHAVTGNVTRTTTNGDMTDNVTTGAYNADVRAGNWKVTCTVGNIQLQPLAGKVQMQTNLPDAVELSDNPTMHGTKYEALASLLNTFVADYNLFKGLVLSHVHPLAPGGTGPAPSLATALPLQIDWSAARSLVVKLN